MATRPNQVRKDVILGGPGHDRLMGGTGEDWIFGGPGNDVISGGYDRGAPICSSEKPAMILSRSCLMSCLN